MKDAFSVILKNLGGSLLQLGSKALDIGSKVYRKTIGVHIENSGFIQRMSERTDAILAKVGEKAFAVLEPRLKQIEKWFDDNQDIIQKWVDIGGNALADITRVVMKVVDAVIQNWPMIEEVMYSAWIAIEPVLGQLLGFMESIISWVLENLPLFKSMYQKEFSAIGTVIQTVVNILSVLWNIWVEAWPVISSVLETQWSIIGPAIEAICNLVELLGIVFEAVFPYIVKIVEFAWEQIKPIFENISKAIGMAGDFIGKLKDGLKGKLGVEFNFKGSPGNLAIEPARVLEVTKRVIEPMGRVHGMSAMTLGIMNSQSAEPYNNSLNRDFSVLNGKDKRESNNIFPHEIANNNITNSNRQLKPASGNVFNISINGVDKSSDEILKDLVTRIKEAANTMGEAVTA